MNFLDMLRASAFAESKIIDGDDDSPPNNPIPEAQLHELQSLFARYNAPIDPGLVPGAHVFMRAAFCDIRDDIKAKCVFIIWQLLDAERDAVLINTFAPRVHYRPDCLLAFIFDGTMRLTVMERRRLQLTPSTLEPFVDPDAATDTPEDTAQ